jgi:pterin-4a-carbinolamine dehydratase
MNNFNLQNFKFETLLKKNCYVVDPYTQPFSSQEIDQIMKMIFIEKQNRLKRWAIKEIQGNKILSGRFILKSYQEAFAFVSAIYLIAEDQSYYPDITFGDGFVYVSLFTIKIKGIHENDFIMLTKIENLMKDLPQSEIQK